MYYTSKELVERVKQLSDYKRLPENYWIIGVRNPEDAPNQFDDMFYLMLGEEIVLSTTGTTNPGTPILKRGYLRYNKDGAAVVESDRIYYNVWKYGLHRGKMPALKQLGNSITIYRDGDNDEKSEEIGKRTTGYYGINFHADQYNLNVADKDSKLINSWSAGCQVCNKVHDYKEIIKLCKAQNTVTYVLLNEFSI